jgi:hypothetical protein
LVYLDGLRRKEEVPTKWGAGKICEHAGKEVQFSFPLSLGQIRFYLRTLDKRIYK